MHACRKIALASLLIAVFMTPACGKQSPVPTAPEASTTSENAASDTVVCECEVLAFDPGYVYCDHDVVGGGDPSSIGSYPWFRIKITSPRTYNGRELEIIYQSGDYGNQSGDPDNHAGKPCTVELPKDFLDGTYKTIIGDSVRRLVIHRPRR